MMRPRGLAENLEAALGGDRRSMGRLLTALEDRHPGWREIMATLDARAGQAHLIGITGAPGAGKSTLTAVIAKMLLNDGVHPALVAVDPSSPYTGGALLGDRIRMDSATGSGLLVRSMAARGRLGGLASTTSSLVTAFDALGRDPVLIETVGVGQSEVEVVDIADTVVVVVSPEWGDAIQAGKAGITEIADIFVVNKSDRSGAGSLVKALTEDTRERAGWNPPVVSTVAIDGEGVDEVIEAMSDHAKHLAATDEGEKRRRDRRRTWLRQAIQAEAATGLTDTDHSEVVTAVENGDIDPWNAAHQLMKR